MLSVYVPIYILPLCTGQSLRLFCISHILSRVRCGRSLLLLPTSCCLLAQLLMTNINHFYYLFAFFQEVILILTKPHMFLYLLDLEWKLPCGISYSSHQWSSCLPLEISLRAEFPSLHIGDFRVFLWISLHRLSDYWHGNIFVVWVLFFPFSHLYWIHLIFCWYFILLFSSLHDDFGILRYL